jgi:hypothetical protein
MIVGSVSALSLAMILAGLPLDFCDQRLMQAERRVQEFAQTRHPRQARELQEDLMDVLPDRFIGGEQAIVGVEPRGLGVVIAGSQVAVPPQPLLLAPHDHHELRVGLESDDAIHHVCARLLELVRQLDIRFLVEARPQLDDDRHVLARLRRFSQRVDDRRVASGAVQRLFDCENLRVTGRLLDEIRDGAETLEGMVQQYVGGAQGCE